MEEKNIIIKEDFIRYIAKKANKTIVDTKKFYNAFEDVIFDLLSSVNEEKDLCIKMFEGISLDGKYISEKEKKSNLTGEVSFVNSKIKPKFRITRSYCEKLNNELNDK